MSTDRYNNRLEKIFSQIIPPDPEPGSGDTSMPAAGAPDAQPSFSLTGGDGHDKPGPAPLENRALSRLGWDAFLDGIHHKEDLGYLFDQTGVKPVEDSSWTAFETGAQVTDAVILAGDEAIGKLWLEYPPDRQMTPDEAQLINVVLQQLSQQMETLRLLDEAQRSRGEAEGAYHHLAQISGHSSAEEELIISRLNIFGAKAEDKTPLKFEYVRPDAEIYSQSPSNFTHSNVMQTSLRVNGKMDGRLSLVGEHTWTAEDVGVVETVAEHLSRQIENLRLLDESRHYRTEAEQAIRRLTYESWQAYLNNRNAPNLAFQYKDHQVNALENTPVETAQPDQQITELSVRDEVIGQVSVESPAAAAEDAEELVRVVAERLSEHLEGLRLAEQREQALTESETLYSISSRLSTSQSLEDALSSVSDPSREMGARDSRLFFITLDEGGQPDGLTLAAIWYPDDGPQIVPVSAHFTLDSYPIYRKILVDPYNPLLIDDVRSDPRLDSETGNLFIQSGAKAVAVLPLAVSGRWVGVIFINWEECHTFSEAEKRLYASLSRQAAVVVNNRLLLEQTRKRAQELQIVAQVSTAASTILDPGELLQSVVDLTKSSFSLYHAQVYIYREDERFLQVWAGAGEVGRKIAAEQKAISLDGYSAVARAARERQVIIVSDVKTEEGFAPNPFLPETRSEMALPMVVGSRLLGVFNVQANFANRFSREDARIYNTLASQVAVALQNAELYAEQSATVERLRELDHLKSAFLANMSHELRTPLNSILGFAEVLLLGLDGPLNETMTNDVHLIEKNGKHLLSLINDVLDMAKIEAGKMNLSFEKFMLRELMEETIDITSSLAREKAIQLVIHPESQDQIELVADRVRIRQVLINVIANAVKFTSKGGITLRAVQNLEERRLRLYVKDTGLGIPPDKLESIFDSFSQVDTSTTRKAGGTGLGLPISRRLIEMHGGRLWAESQGIPDDGSTFIIEIPFEAVKRIEE